MKERPIIFSGPMVRAARAEGVESVAAFADLWTSLYPDGPKAWAATPWVWVVGFRALRR